MKIFIIFFSLIKAKLIALMNFLMKVSRVFQSFIFRRIKYGLSQFLNIQNWNQKSSIKNSLRENQSARSIFYNIKSYRQFFHVFYQRFRQRCFWITESYSASFKAFFLWIGANDMRWNTFRPFKYSSILQELFYYTYFTEIDVDQLNFHEKYNRLPYDWKNDVSYFLRSVSSVEDLTGELNWIWSKKWQKIKHRDQSCTRNFPNSFRCTQE